MISGLSFFLLNSELLNILLSTPSVIDLLKILGEDLPTLYKERSAACTVAASFYCFALSFIQQRCTFEQVIGDLFGVSVLSAYTDPFTRFQGLTRNEKNIPCHFLRT